VRRSLLPSSRYKPSLRLGGFDLAAAAGSPLVAFALRDPSLFDWENAETLVAYDVAGAGATLAFLSLSRLGRGLPGYFAREELVSIVKVSAASVALTVTALFATTRMVGVPRTLPLIHLTILFAALAAARWARDWRHEAADPRALPRRQPAQRNILVIGANKWTWLYAHIVDSMARGGQKIVAVLDADPVLRGRTIHGLPIVGRVDEIDAIMEEYAVHGVSIQRVVVAGRRAEVDDEVWGLLSAVCEKRGAECDAVVDCLGPFYEVAEIDDQSRAPPPVTQGRLGDARNRRLKRIFDVGFACLALVLLAPLFSLVYLAVLLTVGMPAIFWQQRVGCNGEPLFVYKFRTLRAPFRKDGVQLAEEQRLTRVGRLLRATRLDELPQIVNVLRGDMSIVGPRPLLKSDQPEHGDLRLSVAPGLTGWAQIHGGRLIAPSEKNALDEWYVRNWSIWLDLRIIAQTIATVLQGDRRDERVHSDREAWAGRTGR